MSNILSSKVVAGVKDQSNFLQGGVHTATFKGVEKDTFKSNEGKEFTTMAVLFEVEGFGEYKHRIFEPTSTERQDNTWGQSPSQVEQFFVTLKHLLNTTNPAAGQALADGTSDIDGNFVQVIAKVKEYTKGFVGKTTKVKMLPQKNGFNQFPGFPARITSNGNLVLGTKFIGDDLTLSAYEMEAIAKAKAAQPTNMAGKSGGVMSNIASDMATADDVDDLPF